MANIYEQKTEEIYKLLEKASAGNGATIVIPDLQRPFVWKPSQVILLLDSLIRGWPFGTLLMWEVNHNQLKGIPHREFWQVVDRTANEDGATVQRKDPPASYQMVLDGQQRIQSLLLALCGDSWGFKLEDREWLEWRGENNIRPRGRKPKNPHWSKATLCFNVKCFLKEYKCSNDVIGVDYKNVLVWAITDPQKGQSAWTKPENYQNPLCKAFDSQYQGQLIRLSRFWDAVPPNSNLKEKDFRNILTGFLKEQEVPHDTIQELLQPMGELMSTLRDVKLSKVTYLELRPHDSTLESEDEYNSAIVNIFTRLNTAGRTLTREEITFAWLKVNWDKTVTKNQTAGQCFSKLLEHVRNNGLSMEMDDLVRTVSFLWCISSRGILLSDKDLLNGEAIRPLSQDIAQVWDNVVETITTVLSLINERKLQYGSNAQYNSLTSLNVLWGVWFLAICWRCQHNLSVTQKDSYQKSISGSFEKYVDRWLICSHWAGRWGGSTNNIGAIYAKDLYNDYQKIQKIESHEDVLGVLDQRMENLVQGIEVDAINCVNEFHIDRREQVSRYNTFLWVWHRLEEKRWEMSQIQLRKNVRGKCDLEVDHTVSHAFWESKLNAESQLGQEKKQELFVSINSLGNCFLLEKNFNISKGKDSLEKFLNDVHEFKFGKADMSQWCDALLITRAMFDPIVVGVDEIYSAINERDKQMRIELSDFVRGKKNRYDL